MIICRQIIFEVLVIQKYNQFLLTILFYQMQSDQKSHLFVYPLTKEEDLQLYRKRLSVQQFKLIDAKRIKLQFQALQDGILEERRQLLSLKKQQSDKNRYSEIVPYFFNRVICPQIEDYYINASFMKSVTDNYIFAIFGQAPFRFCMNQFWQCCYHYNVKKIVMLCPLYGANETYWPLQKQQTLQQAMNLTIKCKQRKQIQHELVQTIFTVIGPDGEKEIQHLNWLGWNDMSKPSGQNGEDMFLKMVKHCIETIQKKEMLFVHCRAGVGRTGTLGAVIEGIRCAKINNALSVFEIVQNLRQNRLYSVETFEQYKFVYSQISKMI